MVPVLSMGARDGSSTGSRARRSWGKRRGRPVRACRGSGAFYRREGEEDQLASDEVVPGGGRFGQGGRRRQATASGDAVWAAWRMAGVVAAVQVTMGAWQAEDKPGRRGSEPNQGRAGPYGRSRGGLPSPEYGRRERRELCWRWQFRK